MKIIKEVTLDGVPYPVLVSDENEALLAAKAAGRAIVGIWRPFAGAEMTNQPDTSGFDACLYLVTKPEEAAEELLMQALLRHLDRPWTIAETERLRIREFSSFDPLEPPSPWDGSGVFSDWEKREAYRKNQYRFCECGLWALVEKRTGAIIGKAGITDGELGYHIYEAYRRRGYAGEACRAVLSYAEEEMALDEITLRTDRENFPSMALAKKLGFAPEEEAGGERIYRKRLHPPEKAPHLQ